MPRVVAIGDFNEDLLMDIDVLPEQDSQVVAHGSTSSGGGSAANFAVACSKLGVESALYAAVGDDARGEWLQGLAARMGVDMEGVEVVVGAETGITVAMAHGGMRTMTSHPGSNAFYEGKGFDAGRVRADWVHLTSYFLLDGLREAMPSIAEELSGRSIPLSFDPGWHHGALAADNLEAIGSIISCAELFCPNMREAGAYLQAPDADAVSMARLGVKAGAKVSCVTMGEAGCVVCERDEVISVPAFPATSMDSCGAGDVFAAGFTVARLSGVGLLECAMYAGAAAALSLRGSGWESYPNAVEVERLLLKSSR